MELYLISYMRGLEDGLHIAREHPNDVETMITNLRMRTNERIRITYLKPISDRASLAQQIMTPPDAPEENQE